MTKVASVIAGLFILLFSGLAVAFPQVSGDSVSIGDVVLRPGMPQSVVLEKLGKDFDIERLDNGDHPFWSGWAIWTKDERKNDVGRVDFENGRLVQATKTWANLYDDNRAIELAQAVLGVIANFEQEGATACTIRTDRRMHPGVELNVASVTCGKRELAVTIYRKNGKSAASVEETIYP
jgi:hypothetical protein